MADQKALYHCPNRSCDREFKVFTSLINHLESESCGFIRFQAVQKKLGDIVSSKRRIQF